MTVDYYDGSGLEITVVVVYVYFQTEYVHRPSDANVMEVDTCWQTH